jgi:hypothetical protein
MSIINITDATSGVIQATAGTLTAATMTAPPVGHQHQRVTSGEANSLPASGTFCLLDQNARGNRIIINHDFFGVATSQPFLSAKNTISFTKLVVQSMPKGVAITLTVTP